MDAGAGAAHVLVVDDELANREFVVLAVRYAGHEATSAGTLAEARHSMSSRRPDLLVLDVMLPDGDGLEFAERLRAQADAVPILFLTARDSVGDRVRGLRAGDDYLVKPFAVDELLARVDAVLRRTRSTRSARLAVDDLILDDTTREVRRGGVLLDLTDTEFRLLRYLLANPRRVLTREQLLEEVWQYDFQGDSGVLATYISYLRKKIDALGPPLIHTVRSVGYVLRSAQ
ncbi:MAG: two component transcriptional regulator, winged helix family [Jatrophihabitantaceae bacterium]|nr:two component transcriptional regulator, winged helix family [Jatrophihabitantaceae bacterium]